MLQHNLECHAVATYFKTLSQYKNVKQSAVSGAQPEFFSVEGVGEIWSSRYTKFVFDFKNYVIKIT